MSDHFEDSGVARDPQHPPVAPGAPTADSPADPAPVTGWVVPPSGPPEAVEAAGLSYSPSFSGPSAVTPTRDRPSRQPAGEWPRPYRRGPASGGPGSRSPSCRPSSVGRWVPS